MPTPPPTSDDSSGSTGSERSDDTAVSDVLDTPDAVVYDLDGTLVDLAVDWDAVADDVIGTYAANALVGTLVDLAVDWDAVADDVIGTYAANALVAPTADLWTLLDSAAEYGVHDAVEETIAGHERSGAHASTRLPLGDWLATGGADRPVAVCSLNCEDACRVAVETHDLTDHVDAVVGRDTAATHKPEPESLLAAIDALGVEPTRTLFVGDSASDRLTADRAGVPFATVSEALGR